MIPAPDFWRLRGLIDALGHEGAAARLGCTPQQLTAAIWPGDDAPLLERVRRQLAKQVIAPFVKIADLRRKEAA